MNQQLQLYYIHDPMCSWCWGFKPVLKLLTEKIEASITIKYVLGGLAADTNMTMPEAMQQQIQSTWKKIQKTIPGTEFNYDFWLKNTPRRSSYPACRAIIAATKQSTVQDLNMLEAIQTAYYRQARNPSDDLVLYELADELDLDAEVFKRDLHSEETHNELMQQINFSRTIGADSFPSLFINSQNKYYPVVLDYNNVDIILEHLQSFN